MKQRELCPTLRGRDSAYASGLTAMGAQSEARLRRAVRFFWIIVSPRLLGVTVAEPHTLPLDHFYITLLLFNIGGCRNEETFDNTNAFDLFGHFANR
jgi:hypothetical protein